MMERSTLKCLLWVDVDLNVLSPVSKRMSYGGIYSRFRHSSSPVKSCCIVLLLKPDDHKRGQYWRIRNGKLLLLDLGFQLNQNIIATRISICRK